MFLDLTNRWLVKLEKSVESEENTEELKPESAELTEDVSNEELADNMWL